MSLLALKRIQQGKIVRRLVEDNGLHEFVRQFFPVVEPATKFVDGWHIGAICRALEAVSRRHIRKLVINVPPGHMKSLCASVMWNPWHWTWDPGHKFGVASFDDRLIIRDARRVIDILQSDLFQNAWPELSLKNSDSAAKIFFNNQGGLRFSTTPGGAGTGWHFHTVIVDDPMKAADARSPLRKQAVSRWYRGTLSTRKADPSTFAQVLIMQRLAHDDLAGELLEEGYEHLMLPAEYVPNAVWDMGSSLGKLDERTEPGELLWPERIDAEALEQTKRDLKTPAEIAAQLQQNPTPDEGGIIERGWIGRWSELPPNCQRTGLWITSWDLGFDGKTSAHSRVAAGLWWGGMINGQPRYYLVDGFAQHLNYPQTKERFRDRVKSGLWSHAKVHLVEEKANGPALIAELKKEIPGIVPTNPKEGKEARLIVHSGRFQAGEVFFPASGVIAQADEFVDELVHFPRGSHDDVVDMTTQALDRLSAPFTRWAEAFRKLGRMPK